MRKRWAERILEAEERGFFTGDDFHDMGSWGSCFVGEAEGHFRYKFWWQGKLVQNERTMMVPTEAWVLGTMAPAHVMTHNFTAAKNSLSLIYKEYGLPDPFVNWTPQDTILADTPVVRAKELV